MHYIDIFNKSVQSTNINYLKGKLSSYSLLCILVIILGGVILHFNNESFFYCDDFQASHLPLLKEIERAINSGELPLISKTNWSSGSLVGDANSNIFNPPIIFLYYVAKYVFILNDAGIATFISISLMIINALGMKKLLEYYKIKSNIAVFAALTYTFSGFFILFEVSTWMVFLLPVLYGCRGFGDCLISFGKMI